MKRGGSYSYAIYCIAEVFRGSPGYKAVCFSRTKANAERNRDMYIHILNTMDIAYKTSSELILELEKSKTIHFKWINKSNNI